MNKFLDYVAPLGVALALTLAVTAASAQGRAASRTADFYDHNETRYCIGQLQAIHRFATPWWYVGSSDECLFDERTVAGKQIIKMCEKADICNIRAVVSHRDNDYVIKRVIHIASVTSAQSRAAPHTGTQECAGVVEIDRSVDLITIYDCIAEVKTPIGRRILKVCGEGNPCAVKAFGEFAPDFRIKKILSIYSPE